MPARRGRSEGSLGFSPLARPSASFEADNKADGQRRPEALPTLPCRTLPLRRQQHGSCSAALRALPVDASHEKAQHLEVELSRSAHIPSSVWCISRCSHVPSPGTKHHHTLPIRSRGWVLGRSTREIACQTSRALGWLVPPTLRGRPNARWTREGSRPPGIDPASHLPRSKHASGAPCSVERKTHSPPPCQPRRSFPTTAIQETTRQQAMRDTRTTGRLTPTPPNAHPLRATRCSPLLNLAERLGTLYARAHYRVPSQTRHLGDLHVRATASAPSLVTITSPPPFSPWASATRHRNARPRPN